MHILFQPFLFTLIGLAFILLFKSCLHVLTNFDSYFLLGQLCHLELVRPPIHIEKDHFESSCTKYVKVLDFYIHTKSFYTKGVDQVSISFQEL
jgi:hypothetical protein